MREPGSPRLDPGSMGQPGDGRSLAHPGMCIVQVSEQPLERRERRTCIQYVLPVPVENVLPFQTARRKRRTGISYLVDDGVKHSLGRVRHVPPTFRIATANGGP